MLDDASAPAGAGEALDVAPLKDAYKGVLANIEGFAALQDAMADPRSRAPEVLAQVRIEVCLPSDFPIHSDARVQLEGDLASLMRGNLLSFLDALLAARRRGIEQLLVSAGEVS